MDAIHSSHHSLGREHMLYQCFFLLDYTFSISQWVGWLFLWCCYISFSTVSSYLYFDCGITTCVNTLLLHDILTVKNNKMNDNACLRVKLDFTNQMSFKTLTTLLSFVTFISPEPPRPPRTLRTTLTPKHLLEHVRPCSVSWDPIWLVSSICIPWPGCGLLNMHSQWLHLRNPVW